MFCFEGDFQPYLSTMTVTAGKIHSPSFKGSRTGTEIVDPPREKLGGKTHVFFTRLGHASIKIVTHDGKDDDQSSCGNGDDDNDDVEYAGFSDRDDTQTLASHHTDL